MTLRFPSYLQQLLFAGGCALLLASGAAAQDVIIDAQGQARQVKVVGLSANGQTLEFLVGQGKLGLPLSQIKEVRLAANPPEVAQAYQAYLAKDYAKAQVLMRGVMDKFRGIPALWAQQVSGMMVDIDLAQKDMAKAEADYAAFLKAYPASGLQADVLAARMAVAKSNMDVAKAKLAPITDAALKEKSLAGTNAIAYSQAFLASGQVKEAEGNFNGALEDYLRTVTIFYHDRAAAAVAQERADALRKQHKDAVVP
jgi:hypothetical protein